MTTSEVYNRAKLKKVKEFLDPLIDRYSRGKKDDGIRFINTKEAVLKYYRNKQAGIQKNWLNELRQYELKEHILEASEYYYTSGHGNQILIMIDVDAHTSGTVAGCMAFLRHLKDHHFPRLYYEQSKRGAHGYLVLNILGLNPKIVKDLCNKHFYPFLSNIAKDFDCDLDKIKGLPPVYDWGPGSNNLLSFTQGSLAKFPVQGLGERFEEFRRTQVLDINYLRRLPRVESHAATTPSGSVLPLASQPKERRPLKRGSTTGHSLDPDQDLYLRIAKRILPTSKQIKDRYLLTAEDLGIMLRMLVNFSENLPENGAMPRSRFEGLWNKLLKEGEIKRAWCNKRFTVMRNMLADLQLIDFEDNCYTPGGDVNGVYIKGKAMCWHASELLVQLLERERACTCATRIETPYNLPTIVGCRPCLVFKIGQIPIYNYDPDTVTRKLTGYLDLVA